MCVFFFFKQKTAYEVRISDGVQTCALPISAKGGVRFFSKAVALECAAARDNIRVNSVHPGIIDTPIFHATEADERRSPVGAEPMDVGPMAAFAVPMGRPGVPDDIAGACLYLASDDARYVTGTELVVDGGFCAA